LRGANESNTFDDFGIGQDRLVGGSKDDIFHLFADPLTDNIDGGYGIDIIDYSGKDRALHIDLYHGVVTANFGFNLGVTVAQVQNVENATGSSFGDTILGTDTDNTGAHGANVLDGDDINGGNGIDTVSYDDRCRGRRSAYHSGRRHRDDRRPRRP
jgi:hypothetical protein